MERPAPSALAAARTAAALGALAAGALAAMLGAAAGCGSRDTDSEAARAAGGALAGGLIHAVAASASLREPFRCAEADSLEPAPAAAGGPLDAGSAGGRPLTLAADELRIGPRSRAARDRSLVLGVVADSRGATEATMAQLAEVRRAFTDARVELVITLGGMGTSEGELRAVLGALAAEAPWPVWAIPGDREALPAHRAVVGGLRAAGLPVFDGARTRLVSADGVMLAGFPGVERPGQLLAGPDGCVHRADDAAALAARLAAHRGPRIWAGHAPPRQRGPAAGDLALGGVHVGERLLVPAVESARAHLVLHGLVDQAALGSPRGQARFVDGAPAVVLGAGPVEAVPISGPSGPVLGGAALVVTVSERTIAWRRVQLPLPGQARPR